MFDSMDGFGKNCIFFKIYLSYLLSNFENCLLIFRNNLTGGNIPKNYFRKKNIFSNLVTLYILQIEGSAQYLLARFSYF